MRNVIEFTGSTTLDIDPDKVLREAIGKLDSVVIMGYTKDSGEMEEYSASSYGDCAKVLWLIKRLERELLENGFE